MALWLTATLNGERRSWPLDRSPMRVGRSSTNAVRLLDASVSREHAELRDEHGIWTIRDLGSRLGTRVDGAEVHRIRLIAPGSSLEVGRVLLEVVEADTDPWTDPRVSEERERVAREAATARGLQQQMLGEPPTVPGWLFHARIAPSPQANCDFWDLHLCDDGELVVLVGDVSGKGAGATILMSSALSSARAAYEECRGPVQLVTRVNETLRWNGDAGCVTMFVGWLAPATGRLRYVNACFPEPYLVQTKKVVTLEATGVPLGMFADFAWIEAEVALHPGETLALYSDGIILGLRDNHSFDRRCFVEALRQVREERDLAAMANRVMTRIGELAADNPRVDDMTLVLIRREFPFERTLADTSGQALTRFSWPKS